MSNTVIRSYLGWDITIRCSHRSGVATAIRAATFTAIAEAELQADQDPAKWVDARMQMINTGNRSFGSDGGCIDSLFAEAMELIDALRR